MYNNYQQTPAYQSSASYVQPPYASQYGQAYATQQSQPVYQTQMSQQSAAPIYAPQQSVYQTQMSQQSAVPMYAPQQSVYASAPQVPPPSYAMAMQSQQSQTYAQPKQSTNNPATQNIPFTPGYKWPHNSVQLVCPKCGASVSTRIDRKVTAITIIAALLLLLFSCILVCLPFCIPACKKTYHYCPYCGNELGIRRELR